MYCMFSDCRIQGLCIYFQVCDEYEEHGIEFLNKVFKDPCILEKLTGLDKLREGVVDEGFEWDSDASE